MKTIIINHYNSLDISIIYTNMPRSDPSKYFYISFQFYFIYTRRLSGPPLIYRLWKHLKTLYIVCLSYSLF
jgi:hypothetical protein